MNLDLHVHSKFSFDSLLKPKDILNSAKKKGLNGIAITDHNTIKGALEVKRLNQDRAFLVIVGAEISTEMGDLIGLFLKEEIGLRDSIKVIEEIHRQGGIAVLPHPYKGHTLNEEVIRRIDIIECFNSRTSKENNRKALKLSEQYNKPIIAGSDAHFGSEIGMCKVILDSTEDRKLTDVRNDILHGRLELETNYIPTYMQSISQIIKSIKLGKYNKLPIQFMSLILKLIRRNNIS